MGLMRMPVRLVVACRYRKQEKSINCALWYTSMFQKIEVNTMACRVGITTRPEERKSEWEREYRNFRNWKIIGPFEDRKRAQQVETNVAKTHGCEAHPGGRDPDSTNGPWSVYQFEYDERIESFTESFLNKFKPL